VAHDNVDRHRVGSHAKGLQPEAQKCPNKFKKDSIEKAKTIFNMPFKDVQVEKAENHEKAAEPEVEDPAHKRRKLDPSMKRDCAVDLVGLLGREDEEDEDQDEEVASAKDEWALYLEEPQIAPTADVLKSRFCDEKWRWKHRERNFFISLSYATFQCKSDGAKKTNF